MGIKKIKAWIDSKRNPQFMVLERYHDGVNVFGLCVRWGFPALKLI